MQWTKGTNTGEADYSNEKTWKPETADTIQGNLVSKKTVNGADGQPVTVLKLENGEGVWNVWCSRKGLKDLVAEYDEQLIIGRLVGIKTDGPTKLESGRTFFPYELGFGEDEDVSETKPAATETVASQLPELGGEEVF